MEKIKPFAIMAGMLLLSVTVDALYSHAIELAGQSPFSLNLLLVRIRPIVWVAVATIIFPFLVNLLFFESRKLTFSLMLTGIVLLALLMPVFLGAYMPKWFSRNLVYVQVMSSRLNLTNQVGAIFTAIGFLRLLPKDFLARITGVKHQNS